jgi:Na+/H+-translocating membrane pyrophosphatase
MYYQAKITAGDVVWCLEAGLVIHAIILLVSEVFTSHSYSFVSTITTDMAKGFSLALMTASVYSSLG